MVLQMEHPMAQKMEMLMEYPTVPGLANSSEVQWVQSLETLKESKMEPKTGSPMDSLLALERDWQSEQ